MSQKENPEIFKSFNLEIEESGGKTIKRMGEKKCRKNHFKNSYFKENKVELLVQYLQPFYS